MRGSFLNRAFKIGILLAARRSLSLVALACLVVLPIGLTQKASADGPGVGLIAKKYKDLGGSAGVLGRPTSKEMPSKEGKGRYQTFERGVIGWSPSTGTNSMQALYANGQDMVFEWGDTAPFHYKSFLVRWDLDGKNVGQEEVKGGSSGRWVTRPNKSGRYRLVVEGRDGTKSRQGWSNSLYLDFVPPPPDYTRYRPAVKERQPTSRQVTRYMPKDLYLKEWMRLGGPDGPMGLPLSEVQPHPGGGKGGYVPFQNGQISFSPAVWENGILAAYQDDSQIVVDWIVSWGEPNPPSHFNYDKFIIRWDFNDPNIGQSGTNIGQKDINANGGADDTHLRTRGLWRLTPDKGTGNYTFIVEGVDVPKVGRVKARQGWMKPVTVHFVQPPKEPQDAITAVVKTNPRAVVNLKKVPPATSVADAKARFDQRIAAAILHNACFPLPHTMYRNEGSFGITALAKLAYPDYFKSDRLPGRDYRVRDEVFEALRRQQVGSKAGTSNPDLPVRTGEYDVALTMLVAIIYKYPDVLPPDVQDHIINDLLNKRGPFDPSDLKPFSALPGVLKPLSIQVIPETENHVLMIESARYLTNQLLYQREGKLKYDNARNGMDEWMLKHLQHILKNDFIEYNARPYQDYALTALLNLFSYTSDRTPSSARVKKAAHLVLDYLMAKVAVSSNDSRRSVTYRRKSSDETPDFIYGSVDPHTYYSMALAGTTDMMSPTGYLPSGFGWGMQWVGLSDYRLPDAILDLMVNRSHRVFFQRFHHYADEAYAGSPSYLISSGGHYATFAYKFAGVKGKHDDIGLALATTFMPTGQFTTRKDLIRFEGAKEDEKRSNMGVAPDFACGLNPTIPDLYGPAATSVDNSGRRMLGNLTPGPWTFIDQSDPAHQLKSYTRGLKQRGYYVVVYRGKGFGFLEAYDTALRARLKFDDFITGVLKRNGKTSFKITGRQSYVMTDGRTINFEISPDSRVFLKAEKPFFVSGTVLNGALGSGLVTIDNPLLRKRIVLDFRDWRAPKRTETAMPR